MTLFQLATKESKRQWAKILGAFTACGLAVTALLAIVNIGAQHTARLRFDLVALFALCMLLFVGSFRQAINGFTALVEGALYQIRLRLCEKVRRTDLYRVEQMGLAEIYDRISRETAEISSSSWGLAIGIYAAVSTLFAILYVGYLSPSILALIAAICLLAGPAFLRRRRQSRALITAASSQQRALFESLTDLLHGHNEIQFRAPRGIELLDDFQRLAKGLSGKTLQVHVINQGNYVFVNLVIFLLLAIHVFILPQYVTTNTAELTAITSSVLFLLNPLGNMLNAVPDYERATFAARQLEALELQLDEAASPQGTPTNPWKGRFSTLRVDGLVFQHTGVAGDHGFSIGPASFSIQAGEIVFIVGGNGSGKTTLLKLLSALYAPSAGALFVDDIPVDRENGQAYREMISAIFTDYHLFKKLYGISGVSANVIKRTLEEMKIADRTSFSGGRFGNLDLSTGQRKRLAMAVALLEDRPLYIFDEWAADQDPQFRHYYYEALLPALKSRGKTVLAISHDDRYFRCADRVITMEHGAITSISGS